MPLRVFEQKKRLCNDWWNNQHSASLRILLFVIWFVYYRSTRTQSQEKFAVESSFLAEL